VVLAKYLGRVQAGSSEREFAAPYLFARPYIETFSVPTWNQPSSILMIPPAADDLGYFLLAAANEQSGHNARARTASAQALRISRDISDLPGVGPRAARTPRTIQICIDRTYQTSFLSPVSDTFCQP
jgi:hypothetical protein